MTETTPANELLFNVRLSIRYHERRQAFLHATLNLTLWLALIANSAVVAILLDDGIGHRLALLPSLAATVFSAACLAYGIRDKANRHDDLRRRFIALEQTIRSGPETDDAARAGELERLAIEADEPRVMRVLALMCHNEESLAMGYEPPELLRISRLQRTLAQVLDWRPDAIQGPPGATSEPARS